MQRLCKICAVQFSHKNWVELSRKSLHKFCAFFRQDLNFLVIPICTGKSTLNPWGLAECLKFGGSQKGGFQKVALVDVPLHRKHGTLPCPQGPCHIKNSIRPICRLHFGQKQYQNFPCFIVKHGPGKKKKASAEIRGEFLWTKSWVNFTGDFLVDFFGPFSLEKTGKINPKIHGNFQTRIWEFRGPNPHCKDPALKNGPEKMDSKTCQTCNFYCPYFFYVSHWKRQNVLFQLEK